jgi:aminopeptidase N
MIVMPRPYIALLGLCLLVTMSATAQRLPTDVTPSHYRLRFAPDFHTDDFAGDETIDVRLERPLTSITLNAAEIVFHEVRIESQGSVRHPDISLDPKREMATLSWQKPLPAGSATIHIAFRGVLNGELRGFYLSHGNNRKYAVTQFESTDARRAFPCFDEPAMKATFDISLVIDKGDTAISNGRIVTDTAGPGEGKHTLHFSTTPKMSTYLVAMCVGDFEWVEGTADGIPIRIITTPGKKHLGTFALQSARQILMFYNRYYGIRYPFGKLDIIAVPDFEAGAMENTAAIVYRETALLIDDKNASLGAHKTVAEILAHEMGHMWFGDLVTMAWWNDIWLNEGFATWITYKPVAAWKPEWHVELDEAQETQDALLRDALLSTRPIRAAASTPAEINELFDGIAYEKTAAVLRMVESYVGPKTFRRGINRYLAAHAYGNATGEDFWNAITAVSGKPVDRIMRSYVDNAGTPLVHVQTACESSATTVTLKQERFYLDPASGSSRNDPSWVIPVCLKSHGVVRCELLPGTAGTFQVPSCDGEVFADADGRGYYYSQYTSGQLESLGRGATTTLSGPERVALIGDTWALVRSGRIPIGDFLDLQQWFRAERDPAVAEVLYRTLTTIADTLTTPADESAFRAWVRELMTPIVAEVGWGGGPSESDTATRLRTTVLTTAGLVGRDPAVLERSRQLAAGLAEGKEDVDPSLRNAVITMAAFSGDAALYDRFAARARGEMKDPEEHYRYLFALTSFHNPALVGRTLEMATTPEIRSQDMAGFIASVLRSTDPAVRSAAWAYVKAHWTEIHNKLTMSSGGIVVRASGFAACDETTRDDITMFFRDHPVESSERALKQTIERIDECRALRARQEANLATWIAKQERP